MKGELKILVGCTPKSEWQWGADNPKMAGTLIPKPMWNPWSDTMPL